MGDSLTDQYTTTATNPENVPISPLHASLKPTTPPSMSVPPSPVFLPTTKPPWRSFDWVYGQLACLPTAVLHALRLWANRQCRSELTIDLMWELLSLEPDVIRATLRDLKSPRHWICRVGQQFVTIPTTIHTLDDR